MQLSPEAQKRVVAEVARELADRMEDQWEAIALVSEARACGLLDCSPTTVSKKLPCVMLGGRKYRLADVKRLVAENTKQPIK